MKHLPLLAILMLGGPACAQSLPDFAAADFTAPRPNPYLPLEKGHSVSMSATITENGETVTARDTLMVLGTGPEILGVPTIEVLDQAFVNGRMIEQTSDYFATDADGNVWYFGETVLNLTYDESGVFMGTDQESTWRAGVDGALPGITMPADLTPGIARFQEHAPANDAMDWAEVVEIGLTLDGPDGPLTDVIKFYEASTVELDLREFKYFAPGIGMVRAEEELSPDKTNPAVVMMIE